MLGTQDLLIGLVLAAFFFGAKRLPELRNIEAGVLITDPIFSRSLRAQFETLVARGVLKSVPGLG